MSDVLQEAIANYKSGNHIMVMSRLGPVVNASKKPDPTLALMLAQSCYKLGQMEQAALNFDRASQAALPNVRQVKLLAANLYIRIKNWTRAYEITRDMVRANAYDYEAMAVYRACLRMLLHFDEMAESHRRVSELMDKNAHGIFGMDRPLDFVFWSSNEAHAAKLTRIDNATPLAANAAQRRRQLPHQFRDRIRVVYISNDLSDRHATMRLVQGVFAAHDRQAFDVHVLCHTEDALKAIDEGMRSVIPNLMDINRLTDDIVLKQIRNLDPDIIVDLKGHTKDARLDLVNLAQAPVKVAWLGFPGINTGIDCDYTIGDRVVTPEASAALWPSKFCRLPETYQPNDDTWRAHPPAASRSELGLPEDKVVFASFNNHQKISHDTFRLWMDVLRDAPDSVLWILIELQAARENFLKAVKKAGVDPARIIFAGKTDYPAHVARLQAADLGIDTFPCNGHTTTSDKLWAGLPLATMRGSSFASRVSESLLRAIGCDGLVADGEAAYVALNVRLATDAEFRAGWRERIAANRFRAPLFDTERFTRHLEQAFRMMVDRARAGLDPAEIDVPALPARTEPFRN